VSDAAAASPGSVEAALRDAAPRVLSALVRRNGRVTFDECEEAVQEALLAASVQWPRDGLPASPSGWLITVASRRLVDVARSEAARRRRESDVAEPEAFLDEGSERDDTLTLLFLCCHPSLSPPSQLALTLRAVGGLTTAEIASAFLVDEATMAQRISRAKARVRGAAFTASLERLDVVLHVLYLLFNEGYTATSGEALARVELSREAIRLARMLWRLLPDEDEVAGLLALMLLTDARRPARLGPSGLVPLQEQDRSLWDATEIEEGLRLVASALASGPVGPYQLQAAIAAVHAEAALAEDTDWPQILALYDLLAATAPNPMVTLNRAVAVGMVSGPAAGLAALDGLDDALAGNHRLDAVRAHLLADLGNLPAAREAFLRAAARTDSHPERTYLESRAASLT
jgi:RNA polymerase sigma factor (sigma-70 family)